MDNKIPPVNSSHPARSDCFLDMDIASAGASASPPPYARAGIAVALLSSALLSSGFAWGTGPSNEHPIPSFKDLTLQNWKERSFSGNSHYEIVDIDGTRALKGSTDGAASILYKKKTINLTKTPTISWTWKIDSVYEDIDEKTRQGDDFPARLYVVVQTGLLPWETLAINYVWSSNQGIGESWPNPFTKNAKMVVVQTGNLKAGQWVTQNRNIAADFKELFGRDVETIDGYAVMVDGDNAGKKGTAWFADINFEVE
ncbi:MAG: hypothetical protein ACI9UN_000802 [Granulosicoccus sp.]|jgi:hypothetical protein